MNNRNLINAIYPMNIAKGRSAAKLANTIKPSRFIKLLKQSQWPYLLFLVMLSLYPRLKYFELIYQSEKGLPNPPDTIWYMERAAALLSNASFAADFNGIFYFGYYGLLAILLGIFKTKAAVVFIQVLVNAFSVILVYRIGSLLFNRRAGFFAGVIYAYTWQIIRWTIYILTDSLFITVLLFTVYYLLKSYRTGHIREKWICAASALYMVFLRPTGVVSLLFISVYILIRHDRKELTAFLVRYKIPLLAVFLCTAATGAAVLSSGMLDTLLASLSKELKWLLHSNYSSGQIFGSRSPYDYKYQAIKEVNYFNSTAISFFINNWYHILILYAKRAYMFWAVWIWNFTPQQVQENIRYFVPVYLFGLIGIIGMIKNRIFKEASILLFIIFSIQFFNIVFFIAISFRYRVPCLAFLNIIAGYGIDRCIHLVEGMLLPLLAEGKNRFFPPESNLFS